MSVLDGLVKAVLPRVPRRLVWMVAQRYVAGADLSDEPDEVIVKLEASSGDQVQRRLLETGGAYIG